MEGRSLLALWALLAAPGPCRACFKFPADMPDPCIGKECPIGAQCRPTADGRNAECVCATHCPTYGDNRGSRPVCGSDGRDYPNVCALQKESCSNLKEIEIKFQGQCDPCDGVQCPAPQVCQLDESRNPTCRCNALCSPELKPVCGSDGRTYTNDCTLRVEACKTRRSLRIIYSGECSSGANPCEAVACGPGQECDIDRYGIATCRCPPPCEPVMAPVCGSDGRTYDNECHLRRHACFHQLYLTVAYRGHCGEEGPCQNTVCDHGAVCVLRSGMPMCECPACSEEFQPVCASDGVTYANPCKLTREACERQDPELRLAHEGTCEGCKDIHCDYYAVCKSDGTKGKCTCPEFCPKVDIPVCGSDGQTYENECEMKRFSCNKQQYVAVTTRGRCDLCLNVHCKYGARCEAGQCVCPTNCPDTYDPVCANDGVTYNNECEMRRSACHLTTPLNALFLGECDDVGSSSIDISQSQCEKTCRYGGNCQYGRDGYVRCTCDFHCPRTRSPVCGSDGRLYDNDCALREEACRQQSPLEAVPCPQASSDTGECNGEPPLKDPITGSIYSCSIKLDCPPSSYCQEGRCCQQVAVIKECADSTHGCCPDGKSLAHGPNHAGCPSTCNCNRLGAYGQTCDPITGQCVCKQGVGGLRCDRCEPGYWGLHKIAEGNNGCAPCGCNDHGSVRDDCEQMTGRCVCKQGIQGMKCDICPTGTVLGPEGCMDASIAKPVQGSCAMLQCRHGARCRERSGRAQCICELHCSEEEGRTPVCGADGHTYGSECQLRHFSCRYQKPIGIRNFGPCKTDDDISPTAGPVRRSTMVHRGDPFEPKSTRDLPLLPEIFLSTHPTTPPEDPVEVPAFSGRSFLEFSRLQAYSRLSLELEFRTFSNEGILLYNGQSATGTGDFVSLAVRDGFVEFRYNLGSGAVVLRSPQRVHPGRFHRLVAKRYLQDGMIALDGQDDVTGRSQGQLKSLDLGENLFLGNVPPADSNGIWENVGVRTGLVGCIRRLKVGRKVVDLHFPTSKDILRASSIRECSDQPCDWRPCRNGATCIGSPQAFLHCTCPPKFTGKYCEIPINPCYSNLCKAGSSTCQPLPQGGFACLCDVGSRGRFCEQKYTDMESDPFVPEFHGGEDSYLELPTLQNVGQGFTLEVWFLARAPRGLLVYNGASGGDYISLYLEGGHLYFSYDLGSGPANLTSQEAVLMDEWHKVVVSRSLRQGTLQLDQGPVVLGQSKGTMNELNLDLPLYVGGVRQGAAINQEAGPVVGDAGLAGVIQRLVVNGQSWDDLGEFPRGDGVGSYQGPPCGPLHNPCRHEGICESRLSRPRCHCRPPFSGAYCEICESPTGEKFCSS